MTDVDYEPSYVIANGVTWVSLGEVVLITSEQAIVELDGEDAELVIDVLRELRDPMTIGQLSAKVGEDEAEAALELLLDQGLAREQVSFADLRYALVSEAAQRGCHVLAAPPLAALRDAVLNELAAAGIVAQGADARQAEEFAQGQLTIGLFASLHDPLHLRLNHKAIAAGAPYLPVVLDREGAIVGPLYTADAPCSRCTALRVLARRERPQFDHWLRAQRDGSAAESGLSPALVSRVAPFVRSFLATLDQEGRFAGLLDVVLRVDVRQGTSDPHRVLRHSGCSACGPRPVASTSVDPTALDDARAATVAHWRNIFDRPDQPVLRPDPATEAMYRDDFVGVLEHAEEWTHRRDYYRNLPECWGGLALIRDTEWATQKLQGINGTGPNLEHMRLVMISEGIERYAQYSHRAAIEGVSFADLKSWAYDPRELTLYDDEQYETPGFPRPRFDQGAPLNWTWGYGLRSKQARLFPQELITVSMTDETYAGRIVDQRLTSGGASHLTHTLALNNALRELIERDQLMIAWYKGIALPRLELPTRTGDDLVDSLLEFLREVGIELEVFDLRLDFDLPTFLVLGTMPESRGSFYAGGTVGAAASDLSPVVALGRALGEMRIHYETLALTPMAMKEYENWSYDPVDPAQGWGVWWPNYMWHLNPKNRGVFDFLRASDLRGDMAAIEDISAPTPREDFARLMQSFERLDLEPWAWDLVVDETSHAGFRVVKVDVPGLCHLTPGRQSRRLACPRLEAVAQRLGRPCLPPGVVNPAPHVQA